MSRCVTARAGISEVREGLNSQAGDALQDEQCAGGIYICFREDEQRLCYSDSAY